MAARSKEKLCLGCFAMGVVGQESFWEKCLETGLKSWHLCLPREKCQPVYFVSRAQTVIKIQSDIINTRKGQGWAGHRI
jgi:hypothetical protein